MKSSPIQFALVGAMIFWTTACSRIAGAQHLPGAVSVEAIVAIHDVSREEAIHPLPQSISVDPLKVSLGQRLFNDPALSRDRTVSCATCHSLSLGGTDRLAQSIGIEGKTGVVNAPTVFNSGMSFRQFWDGRAASLEAQVDGPLQAPGEMGATWDEVIERIRNTPVYAAAFMAIYPDGVQRENVRNAIAEFERSLITPNAPFDRYVRGDTTALTEGERIGYDKFKNYGCISCHQGVNIGANMFQRMGTMGDYFADRGNITAADYGRFNVTGKEEDRYFFKVPSLRNVALTAPYFHDASAPTLEAAVAAMAKYQLGRILPADDLADIVKFLKTLTGEYEGRPL